LLFVLLEEGVEIATEVLDLFADALLLLLGELQAVVLLSAQLSLLD
jgi:hypothetical protein